MHIKTKKKIISHQNTNASPHTIKCWRNNLHLYIYIKKENHFSLVYSNNVHQHPSIFINSPTTKEDEGKKENIEKLFPSISGWKTMKTFVFGSTSCSLINFSLFARCCFNGVIRVFSFSFLFTLIIYLRST